MISGFTWIVEKSDKLGDLDDLHVAIRNSGSNLLLLDYRNDELVNHRLIPPNDLVITYGTIPFVRKYQTCMSKWEYFPIAYADKNLYDVSRWVPILRSDYLNSGYVMFPLRDIVSIENYVKENFGTKPFFIRPNSGYKTFSGHVITIDKLLNLIYNEVINPVDCIVLIAPEQCIYKEFRFVVADHKIIAGSEYMQAELCVLNNDDVWDYAQGIADKLKEENVFWAPEMVYTLDIAQILDDDSNCFDYRVMELNSFSCAGLYDCDKDSIVKGVNAAALKDYEENIS